MEKARPILLLVFQIGYLNIIHICYLRLHRQPLLVIDGCIYTRGDEGCALHVALQALKANTNHGIRKLPATRLAPMFSWNLRHHHVDQQFPHGSEISHGPPFLEDMEQTPNLHHLQLPLLRHSGQNICYNSLASLCEKHLLILHMLVVS